MPGTDTPVANLGRQLFSVLLSWLVWVAVAAVVVAVLWWLLSRRGLAVPGRHLFFGERAGAGDREPPARKFLRISFGLLWIVDGLLQAQPKMPGGFLADVIQPGLASAPSWYGEAMAPLIRAWTRHPVTTDAATVCLQVGLGLLILIGGRGLLAKAALAGSILWAIVVWTVGEAFGGLLTAGASWLRGSPGAVLIYLMAAGLLLLRWEQWESGRAQVIARRLAAGWVAVGALLQAWPGEGMWSASGLAAPFIDGAQMAQPTVVRRPIGHLADLASAHTQAMNAVIVVVLVCVAIALWFSGRTAVVVAGLVTCAATWWLAQDFGVLGGTGTDPNAALPLGLLMACSLATWTATAAVKPEVELEQRRAPGMRIAVAAGLMTLGVGLVLVVPLGLTSTIGTSADAAGLAADSGGGLRQIPPRPAVGFSLTDQAGRRVTMGSLKGKLVVLTFLDPVCTTDCPLIANQLAAADRDLGAASGQVEFVAIDTNPVFDQVDDVDAFTQSHGLADLPNWHFLCGEANTVQNIIADYGISVDVPAVGMIQHSEGVYFITAAGLQAAYLDDGAGDQLTKTYADRVRDEIRTLLR